MTDWNLPWDAACLCGRVKMRITLPPIISMACHCGACQKLTSGPYSLTLMVPQAGFEVLEGAPVIGGLHTPDLNHNFCPHCKNWLFTKGDRLPGLVNFRPTMLEDHSWVAPYVEANVAEKLPGVVTGAKLAFDGFPPPDQYGPLMEAFAREGARPKAHS